MSQTTRLSLLVRLRDTADGIAWSEFVDLYTPVIYRFLRRTGLQDADATDVTQEVFRTVSGVIGDFRKSDQQGSFRRWLMSVVRSRLCDFHSACNRHVVGTGDSAVAAYLEQQPAVQDDESLWQREYRRSVFLWATKQIRDQFRDATWQAFWRTYVEDQRVGEVAKDLRMSEAAVYVARCRVLARLRQKIAEIEA